MSHYEGRPALAPHPAGMTSGPPARLASESRGRTRAMRRSTKLLPGQKSIRSTDDQLLGRVLQGKSPPRGVRKHATRRGRLGSYGEGSDSAPSSPRKGTSMATGEAPVLEALVEINAVSLARTELDPATLLMVRIAALVAVDAPPASYLMHVGPAVESGVRIEDVQDVLVAVAPIIGAPRVLRAAVRSPRRSASPSRSPRPQWPMRGQRTRPEAGNGRAIRASEPARSNNATQLPGRTRHGRSTPQRRLA